MFFLGATATQSKLSIGEALTALPPGLILGSRKRVTDSLRIETMPIYEYQCDTCQTISEVMQKASDPAPSSCDACGKGPMVKQLSLSAFALKGSGWYVTDFKGGQPNKPTTDTPKSDPAPKASDPS